MGTSNDVSKRTAKTVTGRLHEAIVALSRSNRRTDILIRPVAAYVINGRSVSSQMFVCPIIV